MLKRGLPPTHPGEILKGLYIEPLGITVTVAASRLGVTRKALSELLNGHSGVSAQMALRLSVAFNTTPDLWLGLQQDYELWKAKTKMGKLGIKPFARKIVKKGLASPGQHVSFGPAN
jgi:addiction module HigA family antidote